MGTKVNRETQKSVRVILPLKLYNDVKERCGDYGEMSKVIRALLSKWVREKGTVRNTCYTDEELAACAPSGEEADDYPR